MIRLRSMMGIAAMLAGLAIPSVGVAGAASATAGNWETVHVEFSFVEEDGCGVPGLTLEHAFVLDGRERVTAHGPDQLPFYTGLFKNSRTATNAATGESVTEVSNVGIQDLKVTVNGRTLTSISLRAERDVYIHDGHVIARGAGLLHIKSVWDHGGTPTDPSDDEFVEEVVIKEVGNIPDFCRTIIPAIG